MSGNTGLVAGKLAIVTGAGSGIGRETCKVLAREGATIIATDVNLQGTKETVEALPSDKDHIALELNVSERDSIRNVLNIIQERYKAPPTVVINCAGIARFGSILTTSDEVYDLVMNINLKGTFLVMQEFAKAMVNSKVPEGCILNIASILGRSGFPNLLCYSATKAGVINLTKTAAQELAQYNIRANSILPGFIETPMTKPIDDDTIEMYLGKMPFQRMGKPEEIAEAIVLLCSSRNSYMSGASIDVNGALL